MLRARGWAGAGGAGAGAGWGKREGPKAEQRGRRTWRRRWGLRGGRRVAEWRSRTRQEEAEGSMATGLRSAGMHRAS